MGLLSNILSGGKKAKKEKQITEANAYAVHLKESKSIPSITSHLLLQGVEKAFLEENTELLETRAVRKSSGGFGGVRLMKGVTVGKYASTSESHQEWRAIDKGTLTLTNEKVVFDGNQGNRTIPLNKIISLNVFLDSIRVSVDGKSKDMEFSVNNPYIWACLIQILKSVKDPSNLSGVNLDIDFK